MEEIITIDAIRSYDNYGAQQSALAGGDPTVLNAHFEMLYQNELKKATGISQKRLEKIADLENKKTGLIKHNDNLNENIVHKNNSIDNERLAIKTLKENGFNNLSLNQNEINKCEISLEELKNGKKPSGITIGLGDKLQYYITLFIESGFTLYLWLFYTSVIYGAFMMSATKSVIDNLKTKGIFSLTVFNPNALKDAWNTYGFIGVLFLVIAPFFIYALGLLIHKFQHSKQYWKASGIYLTTLILDGLMAFAIVRNIHNANYNAGITNEPFEWKMPFSDTDFWIIILAGFAAYIVWGFILTYIIDEYDNIVPARVAIKTKELEINQLKLKETDIKSQMDKKITDIESQIKDIENEIAELRFAIQNNNTAIASNESEIANLKKVDKDVDLDALRSKISQFFIGWCNQIKLSMENLKDTLIPRCDDIQQSFFSKLNQNHNV